MVYDYPSFFISCKSFGVGVGSGFTLFKVKRGHIVFLHLLVAMLALGCEFLERPEVIEFRVTYLAAPVPYSLEKPHSNHNPATHFVQDAIICLEATPWQIHSPYQVVLST